MKTLLLVLIAALSTASAASGQVLVDTTFTWRGYTAFSTCRVSIYRSAPKAGRPLTIMLEELAENRGPSTLEDAAHLVELVSRSFLVEPDSAFWIFHWGSFSFAGAAASDKELFLRATFRRTERRTLGQPFWRPVDRAAVTEYTDRAYR